MPASPFCAALLVAAARLLFAATPTGAVECTDFPAGQVVSQPDLGAETDIEVLYDNQGVLHAVWLAGSAPAAPADVYHATSTDGGQSFGANVKVNWSNRTAARMTPSFDVDPAGVIYIVWADERAGWPDLDIYFSKSTDGGQFWSPEVRVNDVHENEQSRPALRVTPAGTVYVGWISHFNSGQPTVQIARSIGGLPFAASRQVNGGAITTSCECCNIDIVSIGEQQVFVAFMANLSYIRDLFVSRSTDGGATFSDPVQLNDGHWYVPACPSSGPHLEADTAGTLHAVWLDGHAGGLTDNVYYTRSSDSGVTFRPPIQMNESGDPVFGFQRVAVTPDGVVHAVWERFNDVESAVNLDYAQSADGGLTFSSPCLVAGGAPASQSYPALAAAPNGALTVGWNDARLGTEDVYVSTVSPTAAINLALAPRVAWQAAPNPFRDSVRIAVIGEGAAPAALPAALAVIDVAGRHVRALATTAAGGAEWNGRDDRGREVAPGAYFIRVPGDRLLSVTKLR
jgi:hypothetical protein